MWSPLLQNYAQAIDFLVENESLTMQRESNQQFCF